LEINPDKLSGISFGIGVIKNLIAISDIAFQEIETQKKYEKEISFMKEFGNASTR
jgi:hypothetical protein